ncbi:MAG: ATP synthase F1 subunit delta [Leptolyngbyaceae cyanobacterium MO_188.B28]|nr:ATP synthase F1 subunit delta [Leptolyngbyaceae cyanobacterium MO_188.B28]
MRDSIVTSEILAPYAQALMSLAESHQLTERFGQDVGFLLELLDSSDELHEFLASPLVQAEPKKAVLRQVSGEQVHEYVLRFLMILVDRGRIIFLEGICKQYQELLRKLNQIVLAEVKSAVELSDAQKDAIRQRVIDITGARQVELATSLDSELIGGVIIKVGSQIIDASLRGQLRRIGMQLSSAA